jgi:hypothetical protein
LWWQSPIGGSLVQSHATISLDVLIPRSSDITAALQHAREAVGKQDLFLADSLPTTPTAPFATVVVINVEEEGWNHRLPGYVTSKIDRAEFSNVDSAVAVVRDCSTRNARPLSARADGIYSSEALATALGRIDNLQLGIQLAKSSE